MKKDNTAIKQIGQLGKILKAHELVRDKVIASTRRVIQLSKQVIFGLHRNESGIGNKVRAMQTEMRGLRRLVKNRPRLIYSGSYKVAEQEYVEAMAYYYFVTKGGKLPSCKELGCDPEYYLLGICDFASELVRTATQFAIDGNMPAVEVVKEFVARIHGEFLKLDLRGELRKKSDMVRWSLKNLEDMVAQNRLSRK